MQSGGDHGHGGEVANRKTQVLAKGAANCCLDFWSGSELGVDGHYFFVF